MAATTTRDAEPDTAPRAGRPASDKARMERAVRHTWRPRRTIPATITAAILAAGSLLVAAEIISRLVDRPLGALPVDRLARLGRETQWQDPLALGVAGAVLALGVALLVAAAWPGRAGVVAIDPGDDDTIMAITDGGLRRLAADVAESVAGVSRARVRLRRQRTLWVRADSPLREPGDLGDRVQEAVAARIDHLAPLHPLVVRVAVRHRED